MKICPTIWEYFLNFGPLSHGLLKLHQKKIATLMKVGFVLVDSKLEVYQEWQINKCYPDLYINLLNQPKNFEIFIVNIYWRKRVDKSSNTFDQLLVYWKIEVSRNNLLVYDVWFLICFSKLSSITLSWLITATIFYSPVLLLYSETPGVVVEEKQPYIA